MEPELEALFRRIAHAHEGSDKDRRARYRSIAELVRPGERVLDLGCGDGVFLDLIRERGATGVGVDLDPEKVALVRRKGFEAHSARIQELEWTWGPVDFVSMVHIVEHLAPTEALSILLHVTRTLSDRGRIFILTPNISHPFVQAHFWLDVTHVRPYPALLLNTILEELGLPFGQSGHMAQGLDAWCYGFKRREDGVRRRWIPALNRTAQTIRLVVKESRQP